MTKIFILSFLILSSIQCPMSNMLAFSIETSPSEINLGDPLLIRVFLHNLSDDPVYVNSRFGLNRKGQAGELFFNISNSAGEVPFNARVNIGTPMDEDIVLLLPQNFIGTEINLNDYFELKRAGTYKIEVEYMNKTVHGDDEFETWKGKIQSNTLQITITGNDK